MLRFVISRTSEAARAVAVAAVTAVFLACCAAAPTSAAAASSHTSSRPAAPDVLFLLDSSGSMAAADRSGTRRIDGAKQAVRRVASSLPAGSRIGLRVYGSSARGPGQPCQDTQLVLPVQAADAERLAGALNRFRAAGESPIGLALSRTAQDFPADSPERVVVLVSDGEETCSPPGPQPCDAAASLAQAGVALRVEAVGLDVRSNPLARAQLQCVAAVTGGAYYDAEDAAALADRLDEIASRVLRDFSAGAPARGAVAPTEALVLPDGTYRDAIRPGETRWYAFDVPAGATAQALAGVRGLPQLAPEPRLAGCRAWEAQLLSKTLAPTTYEPYYNATDFDGSGVAATAVRSIGPVSEQTAGLDYPGRWYVGVSLARLTRDGCSHRLPDEDFQIQLVLGSGGPGTAPAGAAGAAGADHPTSVATPRPAADTGSAGSAGTAPQPTSTSVAKFFTEPEPSAPVWVLPLVAVLVTAAAAGGLIGYRAYRRSRYL